MKFVIKTIATLTTLALSLNASAAYIVIDDSDPNTITLTAGDFDGRFYVNQTVLTKGIGNSASQTFPDGTPVAIQFYWDTHGQYVYPDWVTIVFGPVASPTSGVITSGIDITVPTDYIPNPYYSMGGGFAGYDVSNNYGPIAQPVLEQNGQTGFSSLPYLTVSFKSEVASSVPEPAAATLMGAGLAVTLAYARRKRRETESPRLS